MSTISLRCSALVIALSSALGLAGCKQGAGDRCELDTDCEDGLLCDGITMTCQQPGQGGQVPDAGPTPDALVLVDGPAQDGAGDAAGDIMPSDAAGDTMPSDAAGDAQADATAAADGAPDGTGDAPLADAPAADIAVPDAPAAGDGPAVDTASDGL